MKDNYLTGKEVREKIVAGADKVSDAVKGTLGAAGYNYISEHTLYPFYITSNDGVQLAKSIRLADSYEQLGASIMQEIATKADKSSGDGTTTAITLAQAIIHEGMKVAAHPMEIKRSLEECIPIVEAALKDQVREIDVDKVGEVATVSAEDPTIGTMIQKIYQKIGKDGIIFNDAGRDYKDSYTIDKGIHIQDCGFASPYMGDVNENGQLLASLQVKSPLVVVTKQKIHTISDIESIGAIAAAEGKRDLVIFAEEWEGTAMNDMVLTRMKKGFRTILFKFPVLWKDWWIEDIARLTGATIIDPANGITLQKFNQSMFGTCGEIIASGKSETSSGDCFLDGTKDVSEHIKALENMGTDEAKLRAARLNKKTAKYHVGALSEQALKYRHDKVIDALGSAYQALHGGILPGGGVALINCVRKMPDTVGGRILWVALKAPVIQIAKNAGKELATEGDAAMFGPNLISFNHGIDVKTGEVVNMFDAGIVDAYNTVLNSFKSAISVASTILTAQVVTLLNKEKDANLDPFRPYER
ncbi:MAG: hypothetical protein KGJ90_02200 [Patescibacteria group bacterium]|nr:hypothetical protein [Patescibacteria group bacterium]